MHGITSLFVTLLAAATAVQAAPSAKTKRIVCDAGSAPASLYAGDYFSGTTTTKLGYKSVTTSNGDKQLYVVKSDASDSSIKKFQVQSFPCNSTALNYHYVKPGQFEVNTPVKLFTDLVRDGKTYCVGINQHYTTPPNQYATKTHIILTPCESIDEPFPQSNQFWLSTYKFATLFPLIGPSPSEHVQSNNTWPIYPPAANAKPAEYRAGPTSKGADPEQGYRSFYLGQ